MERPPLPGDQLERVNAAVARLCVIFGITGAVLAAGFSSGPANASMNATRGGVELTFFGQWPAALDDEQLDAVIGHELGHLAAHHPASRFGRAKRIATAAHTPIDRRYLWATEMTADRFSLCGSTATPEHIGALSGPGGGSHPDLELRVHAARLFAQSDRFRELTGRGPGRLRLEDVDAEIARLLPEPERPLYRLGDVEVIDTPRWLERRWQRRRDGRRLIRS